MCCVETTTLCVVTTIPCVEVTICCVWRTNTPLRRLSCVPGRLLSV